MYDYRKCMKRSRRSQKAFLHNLIFCYCLVLILKSKPVLFRIEISNMALNVHCCRKPG